MSTSERPRVVIESPLKASTPEGYALHRRYAIACWHDSRRRGEAPYASHLYIAQPDLLDDTVPEQREQGIAIGLAWGDVAELRAVYTDFGISDGMRRGIEACARGDQEIEYRTLPPAALRALVEQHERRTQ